MHNKRDLYLGDKKSYYKKSKRNRFRNRSGNKRGIAIILVFFLAILLGFGTFYLTNIHLNENDDTTIGQEAIRKGNNITDVDGKGVPIDNTSLTQNNTNIIEDVVKIHNKENEESNDSLEGNEIENFMLDFVDNRTPVKVKGIYVTGPRAGNKEYIDELIHLVDTTELNTMVMDIKNDSGEITYKMQIDDVISIGAGVNYISNIKGLIEELKAHDIYLIARIVAFKDPLLAEKRPELSLLKENGKVFKDKNGLQWVNPYKKEVWDYLINVAKEAANLGFDEIQFDYIRFATEASMKEVNFGEEAVDVSKADIITEFTKYACEQLKPLGVYVSADVYGTIIDSKVDAEIVGQNYIDMAKYLDYIYPMIYPSHYANGAYGIQYPDTKPYDLILNVLNRSTASLKELNNHKNKAIVRPWLQDFTAKWLKNYINYGPEEIRAQIKAVYDSGYEEWILWNGSNNYTEEGLLRNDK
jgi:hypothetical protein